MNIFSKLYLLTLQWARHRKAPWILCLVSFTESSFFPIPPDVMLLPMCISERRKAWWFAFITTVSSVAGAILGFAIGAFVLDSFMPFIETMGWKDNYGKVLDLYTDYGLWIVFVAGFTPIPYKLFTIASGAFGLALLPFLLVSFVARGARYGIVAAAGYYGGPFIEKHFMKYFDLIGWGCIIIGFVAILVYQAL